MPEDCDCPGDWGNTEATTAATSTCYNLSYLFAGSRALEANEFDPACLAFTQRLPRETQLPSRSSIRIRGVPRNTWPRERQSGLCLRPGCLGFDPHSPVISVYLCVNDGTYFSVKNKSVVEICRAWKKHQKDERS